MRLTDRAASKVVLVSDQMVGKTSIVRQYIKHSFYGGMVAIIGGSCIAKEIVTRSGSIELKIWDTAGQECYRSLVPMYSRHAAAVIIVTDVTNQDSCDRVADWLLMVQRSCFSDCRFYLVVNKVDLNISVAIDTLEQWATMRHFPFFRTSAYDLTSITAVFERIANDLIEDTQ